MDAGLISICGEESFGTGSDHIREKDGIWAILCWLSILAEKNYENKGKLIGVKEVVMEFWKTYGRDYYCRYDYENLSIENANKVKENLVNSFVTFKVISNIFNLYFRICPPAMMHTSLSIMILLTPLCLKTKVGYSHSKMGPE